VFVSICDVIAGNVVEDNVKDVLGWGSCRFKNFL